MHGAVGSSTTKNIKIERDLKCFNLRMELNGAIESKRS